MFCANRSRGGHGKAGRWTMGPRATTKLAYEDMDVADNSSKMVEGIILHGVNRSKTYFYLVL